MRRVHARKTAMLLQQGHAPAPTRPRLPPPKPQLLPPLLPPPPTDTTTANPVMMLLLRMLHILLVLSLLLLLHVCECPSHCRPLLPRRPLLLRAEPRPALRGRVHLSRCGHCRLCAKSLRRISPKNGGSNVRE